ncbi:MAG: hypothetical protein EXR72_03660 [Myxococcales bacterium]|nr:hypothetical protein [Myxococcales bacterium]
MCCSTVLAGLLVGALAGKMLFRWRRRHHGGGCGPCGSGLRGRHSGGYPGRPFGGRGPWIRVVEALRGLDLNPRQRDEAREVLDSVRRTVGAESQRLTELLDAVGAEPFDRARAEAAMRGLTEGAAREVLDGLEHLHNILTPEQRERLRASLQGGPPSASL